jgi:hypothetical protein
MGQIIEARFEDIVPGEIGFYPIMLEQLIKRSLNGNEELPIPVRKSKLVPGKLVHLDGRHRLLYNKMRGSEGPRVFIAKSRNDYIAPEDVFPYRLTTLEIIENSHLINTRWNIVDTTAASLQVKNYNSYFEQLVKKYPFLDSPEEFLEFSKKHRDVSKYYFMPPKLK